MLWENLPAFLHYFITLCIPLPKLLFQSSYSENPVESTIYDMTIVMPKLYSHKNIKSIQKNTDGLLHYMIELDRHRHIGLKEDNHLKVQGLELYFEKISWR